MGTRKRPGLAGPSGRARAHPRHPRHPRLKTIPGMFALVVGRKLYDRNAMNDRELLRDYLGCQSQDAFRELVRRHLPMVFSAARRIVGDAQLAEEVAQTVFTTLARKAGSLEPSQVVGGWLYNTTRHLA